MKWKLTKTKWAVYNTSLKSDSLIKLVKTFGLNSINEPTKLNLELKSMFIWIDYYITEITNKVHVAIT